MIANVTSEAARLAALNELEVMDTGYETHFNSIVETAALVCDVPTALISLVDSERLWFKASFGLSDIAQAPRQGSLCSHTIQQDELFEVPDAQEDERFANNPLVVGQPGVRFYAGAPLTLPCGNRVGTLCVIDRHPRMLSDKQREILQHLANVTIHILQTTKTSHQLQETKSRFQAWSAAAPLGTFATNEQLECNYTNKRWRSIIGVSKEAAFGHGWSATIHPDDKPLVLEEWSSDTAKSNGIDTRFRVVHAGGHIRHIRLLTHPILDTSGKLTGHAAVVEDITSLYEQKQALHKSELFLKYTGASADVGGWQFDIASGDLTWSEQTCRIHGVAVDFKPTLQDAINFYAVESRPVISAALQRAIEHGVGWDLELPLTKADGQHIWVQSVGNIEYENNHPARVIGAFQNVTQKVQQRQAIKFAHDRMALATDSGNIGIWEWDVVTDELNWTPLMFRLYGLPDDQATVNYNVWRNSLHPDDRLHAETTLRKSLKSGLDLDDEFRIVRADGHVRHIRTTARVSRDSNGKAVRMVGVSWDITQIRSLANKLTEQHALLHVTLQSIGDAVITTDTSGYITWLNPAAEKMTGWSIDDATNRALAQIFKIVNANDGHVAPNPITSCLAQRKRVSLPNHIVLISRNGERYGVEESAAPIRDENNDVLGAVLVFRDVTEQRRLSYEMTYRATHDSLTGLYNRTEFENHVANALMTTRSKSTNGALFFVDLDQFKLVNDACGHNVGDQLLRQIAELIRASVRDGDIVARLGGDEFGVLLKQLDIASAADIAQRLCDRMDEFRFINDERRFRIGTSIGLVPLSNRWRDVADVMKAADVACYTAKDAGRNRVHIWFDTDNETNFRSSQMKWATRLEQALDDDKFILDAQRLEGVTQNEQGLHLEILLRLKSDDGTLVQPAMFLPAAERYHLASRIDRWVLKHALEKLIALTDSRVVSTLCINLSGQSVSDRVFHHDAMELFRNAGSDICKRICIEITETAVVTNLADASVFIEQLHALDIRVALDDFGSGASSFGYLKSLNVDILKIDGQFIQNMLHNPLDAAAVRCFIDVARIQNLQTVAEYVDSHEVLEHVKQMGIDFAQGFLLHKPETLDRLLSDHPEQLDDLVYS